MKAAAPFTAVCVLLLWACTNQDEITRARIAEAAVTGRQATQAVEKFTKKQGRFPAHIEEAYIRPAAMKDIKLMSVERKTGFVRVTLSFPPVEGKSLLFVPSRRADKSFAWRCTSEDIDPRYLPEGCR